MRSTSSVFWTLLAALLALGTVEAQEATAIRRPVVRARARRAVSPPLREMVAVLLPNRTLRTVPNKVRFLPPGPGPRRRGSDILLLDSVQFTSAMLAPTPGPLLSFDGAGQDDNRAVLGGNVLPPDTEGDIGRSHYVQMNNLVFEIFDKSGNSVLGPLPNNALWTDFGGLCESENDGDPIVLYDQLADRWVFTQFAIGADGHQCFAVSQTGDPTGAYFLYDFVVSAGAFNDYPKLAIWPNGYFMSANEFACSGSCIFTSAIATVFEREAMLAGLPARMVTWETNVGFSLQPSRWEGPIAPPASSPNTFVMAWDDETWGNGLGPDGYRLWNSRASSSKTRSGSPGSSLYLRRRVSSLHVPSESHERARTHAYP